MTTLNLTIDERKKLAAEKRARLKAYFALHKKAYITGFVFGFVVGWCLCIGLYDYFSVDKIKRESINNTMVVECFYNKSCAQKIQGLDFTKDNKLILKYATAYKIKQYINSDPSHYQNLASQNKQYIESMLELTK